jgi:AcrR family transcriptional regulator
MATAQDERESDTKSRILDAAAQLFVEKGYESATMKAIAKHVGISPGGLYWHFPSKEAILSEFLDRRIGEVRRFVEMSIGSGAALDRVRAFARSQVLAQLRARSKQHGLATYGVMQLQDALPAKQKTAFAKAQRQHVALLRDIIADGVADGSIRSPIDPTPTAFAILTMCDFVTVWFRVGGRLGIEEIADVYADLAVAMVSSRPVR